MKGKEVGLGTMILAVMILFLIVVIFFTSLAYFGSIAQGVAEQRTCERYINEYGIETEYIGSPFSNFFTNDPRTVGCFVVTIDGRRISLYDFDISAVVEVKRVGAQLP